MLPPQPAFILAPAIKGRPLRGDWAEGLSRNSLKVSQRPPADAWAVPGSNSRRRAPGAAAGGFLSGCFRKIQGRTPQLRQKTAIDDNDTPAARLVNLNPQ
jgi:hypothetical protein